ncbi:MAG: type I DNA topoisomerase [Ruminococcaceae bacterium]|nr:type I DNA topoisomerase [Oscillospiraceae bacterium]
MVNLVIIESPGKVSTIKNSLGSTYKVVASVGHVRDLPKSTLGIDIEDNFKAHYINIRGKGELIRELKKEAKKADRVFLATDPDREGEAISWHLATALDIPEEKIRRVTFNEMTKTAIKAGIKNPREIDMDLVNSQQARRILDRIVGYKLSPFLWKKVKSGLSAGRVQSVATRIIVDRENEIRAFIPKEYWSVDAELETAKGKSFTAHFYGDAATGQKQEITCEAEAMKIRNAVSGAGFVVSEIKKGTKFRAPAAPFTTSTMQQEASRKLNFHSQRTMKVAQELYEGINLGSEFGGVQGLITYMRTDSLRVSAEAQEAARAYIREKYGDKSCPEKPRVYKTKANAQDAHEAVRPADVNILPAAIRKQLTNDQYKLYKLIWERFVASQMESAELATVSADITAAGYLYRASGTTVKFPGFLAVYEESTDEPTNEDEDTKLPALNEGEQLACKAILPLQHFTEPPARYTEASLVKFLEERGIGRPSTFAPIVTLIISRGYVSRQGKVLSPTPLGEITTKLMIESFPDIVDYKFTANMESDLDEIANGKDTVEGILSRFYKGFAEELEKAEEQISKESIELPVEETDIICEHCGARMIIKNGRYGKFAACPNYPECKNTKPLNKNGEAAEVKEPEVAPFKCELCGSDMVLRSGRYGEFYACSRYPECKFTKPKVNSTGVSCPKCGADIVTKFGKNRTVFYSCARYPECDFSSWDMPTQEKCPQCEGILYRKKGKNLLVCKSDGCDYKRECEPMQSGADSGTEE